MSLSRENDSAVVITDTSCLIILNKLSLLDVLHQLFPVIVITPEIAKEYGHDLPVWISVVSVENKSLLSEFTNIIDLDEASAVALAREVKTKYLVTDDLKARKLLIKLKMPVIGTLGILIRAKESDLIPLIKPYIEQIKQINFRVSDNLYQTALIKAGEV